MAKQKGISAEGEVIEVLGSGLFRVKLDNEHLLICHPSGKMRMNNINILEGDKVTVEMSPYDLSKGRIVKRTIVQR